MSQQVRTLSVGKASHIRVLVHVLTVPLLTRLLANVPGKAADDDPGACAPAAHMGNTDGFPSSCFQSNKLKLLWLFEE